MNEKWELVRHDASGRTDSHISLTLVFTFNNFSHRQAW